MKLRWMLMLPTLASAENVYVNFMGKGEAFVNGVYVHGDTTLDLHKPIYVKPIQKSNQRLYFTCLDSVLSQKCDPAEGAWFAGRNLADSLEVLRVNPTQYDNQLNFKFVADSMVLPDSLMGSYRIEYHGGSGVKIGPLSLTNEWVYYTRFNVPMSFPDGYSVDAFLYNKNINKQYGNPITLLNSINSEDIPKDWSFNLSYMQFRGYPTNPPVIINNAQIALNLNSKDLNKSNDEIKFPSVFDTLGVQNIKVNINKDTSVFFDSWYLIKGEFDLDPLPSSYDGIRLAQSYPDTLVPVATHGGSSFELRNIKAPFRIGYLRGANDKFKMNVKAYPMADELDFEGNEQIIIKDSLSKGSAVFQFDSTLIQKGIYPNILLEIDVAVDKASTAVNAQSAPFVKGSAGWQYTGLENGRWKRYTLNGQLISAGVLKSQEMIPFDRVNRSVLIVDLGAQHWLIHE